MRLRRLAGWVSLGWTIAALSGCATSGTTSHGATGSAPRPAASPKPGEATAGPTGSTADKASSPTEKPGEKPGASAVTGPTTEAPLPGRGVVITVIDPGQEPRRPLRYQFKAGGSELLTMDMTLGMNMTISGQTLMDVKVPTMRVGMRFDLVSVSPEGNLRYEFKIVSTGLPDMPADPSDQLVKLQDELKSMESLSGWAVVNGRGATTDYHMNDFPANSKTAQNLQQMLENMRRSMDNMSVPLPDQPVGEGAKWQAKMPIVTKEFTGTQSAEYSLRQLNGNHVMLDVQLTQNIPPEGVQLPPAPPGSTITLNHLESTGAGTMDIDLNNILPHSAMDMSMNFDMSASDQNQKQDIAMKISFGMKMEPTATGKR